MGIIPLGSANGMATELFVNPKPIEALKDTIMSNRIAGLDLLKVNAEIEFDEPRLLQLDGEVIGKFEKIKVEMLKGAVKFITHTENTYIT